MGPSPAGPLPRLAGRPVPDGLLLTRDGISGGLAERGSYGGSGSGSEEQRDTCERLHESVLSLSQASRDTNSSEYTIFGTRLQGAEQNYYLRFGHIASNKGYAVAAPASQEL